MGMSNLDPASRAFMLLALSVACVEIAVIAYRRIRRLLREVCIAWQAGRMALQLRNKVREQAEDVQIDLLIQRMGALAAINLNREKDGQLDVTKLVDALEEDLAD